MSTLDQQIGYRLRLARKACGYRSARAFASQHQIPESTYSQHETGKRSLSPDLIRFYAECFGINPGWLINGPNDALQRDGFNLKNQAIAQIKPLPPHNTIDDLMRFKQLLLLNSRRFLTQSDAGQLEKLFDFSVTHYLKESQHAQSSRREVV